MFRPSLTTKILATVGVTVAVVIAIYTFFVYRVQSEWWRERTQAQNIISATLVHEYLQGVMLSDRHDEVFHFLKQLKDSKEVSRGRVVDTDGTVVFSTETQEVKRTTISLPADLFHEKRILHGEHVENKEHLAIAMLPVAKAQSCEKCHSTKEAFIGAIVLERSLVPAEAAVSRNRALLIIYGILIFTIVGVVVWLLIIRLVTQPVHNVLSRMERVRAGDLTARATAQSHDEIGRLAEGFNTMVTSLETTTNELQESHARQIRQTGKLATIGELASGIAHEIRNPLAGIGAAVEVLAEKSSEQDREIVGEIRRQIQRLNSTLRGLLDFARPKEPEIVTCDIGELVKPMVALARPDAQKAHINIDADSITDLPPICTDPQQIQQAILNILLNGIQAMPHGGTLTIQGEVIEKMLQPGHPRTLRLAIHDTGVGIPPENLDRIFSPFFTTKHRGTGLGLAITRSIIEKNNGHISVQSEVDNGTTVTLEFPVCKQETCDVQK